MRCWLYRSVNNGIRTQGVDWLDSIVIRWVLIVDLAFSKGGLRYSYIMQGRYMHMYMSHRLTLSTERRIQSFTFCSTGRGSPPYLPLISIWGSIAIEVHPEFLTSPSPPQRPSPQHSPNLSQSSPPQHPATDPVYASTQAQAP